MKQAILIVIGAALFAAGCGTGDGSTTAAEPTTVAEPTTGGPASATAQAPAERARTCPRR